MYPPLEHSSRILADEGWEVLFLGIHSRGDSDKLAFPSHPRIKVRRSRYCPPGPRQKLHYLFFNLWAVSVALRWRPGWVYASELFACPAAIILKRLGFSVVYHEHDDPGKPRSSFDKQLFRARQRLARKADVVVLPNAARQEQFVKQSGRHKTSFVVWNTPKRTDADPRPKKPQDRFVVFYHGSIVPERLPRTVVEALKDLPDEVELHIAGYETIGHEGYLAELQRLAVEIGVAARFKYLGGLPRDQLLPLARAAHIGLALMPSTSSDINMYQMVGASNKPFEYLACGCPFLVTDLPEWRQIFVTTELARVCNPAEPRSIAAQIKWFFDHRDITIRMGEAGRHRVLRHWNYEECFGSMLRYFATRTTVCTDQGGPRRG